MTKFFKALALVLALALASLPAASVELGKHYVKLETGFTVLARNPSKTEYSKKPSGTHLYGLALGYKITDHLRSDISIFSSGKFKYRGESTIGDKESQNIKTSAAMLNGYYDFTPYHNFTPYVTIGLGYASNKVNNFHTGDDFIVGTSSKAIAWSIGSGALYKINKSMHLDCTYKYYNFNTINTSSLSYVKDNGSYTADAVDPVKGKLITHSISIGYIYNF